MFAAAAPAAAAAAAAAYELPPPQLSNAISQQYGRHIDLNSKDSTAAVSKLCDCFDLLFEPEIQQLKEVLSSKEPLNVSIRSLLLMNAHSTLIPIEKPCDRSLLSADPLLSATAAIAAARGAAGELPHRLRSVTRADQGAAWAAWTAPMPREVCLDLQVSRRFSRFSNFVYVLRGLLRLNVTNDLSIENDYDYLANVRLDEDPDLEQLFSGLNRTIEQSIENYEQMLELLMAQVNQQGEGRLTEELKNNIRDSLHTFTPIWPESVRAEGDGAGDGAETFKHRIVVITNGENDRYEPNPIWRKEQREAVMQKLAFGISFKAVLIIQTSDTKRICMDFVLNLNKTKLFTEFSHLFTDSTCVVPYLQCWFYLDDLISIILKSDEFKTRISKVLSEKIQNSDVILQSIKSAYDNPSSSFAVVDAGCNHPVGYLSPDPGPSPWTWNDVNFEIIGEGEEAPSRSVMVNLLHRPDLRQEAEAAGAMTVFHCTFPESMRPAFTTTRFTDPVGGLYEGQFSLGEDSLRAVSGSQIEEEAAAAAAAPESPARRIVANIFKTIHTLWGRVVCRFGSGSGGAAAAAAVRPGGASKKKRKSIRTRRASRASRASRRARRSRRSRK